MNPEFEEELIDLLLKHYGTNFIYSSDPERKGHYIRLNVWKEEENE